MRRLFLRSHETVLLVKRHAYLWFFLKMGIAIICDLEGKLRNETDKSENTTVKRKTVSSAQRRNSLSYESANGQLCSLISKHIEVGVLQAREGDLLAIRKADEPFGARW